MVVYASPAPAAQEPTEKAIIRRAHAGDDVAWAELVRIYQEPAFRLAYLILGDADDAADAAQEAFIRAYLSLDSFDQSRPIRPWLLQIVANQARNHKRSLGRYFYAVRRYLESHTEEDLVTSPAGADLADRQQAQTLYQALQKLKRPAREVLYCRYFLSLSAAETAEVLQIAPGTVKSRTYRALEQCRHIIARHYPDLWESMGTQHE